MPLFNYEFSVDAPVEIVSQFHGSTDVLKKLSPPPMFVKIHDFGELQDGMIADFTLWLGPIPLHWRALHSNVSESGFTDTQIEGPLATWAHTHTFSAEYPYPDPSQRTDRILTSKRAERHFHPPALWQARSDFPLQLPQTRHAQGRSADDVCCTSGVTIFYHSFDEQS